MFSKILVANRGEIAIRIIRACKEMGIATVAVFSEADREALHVSLADESICIGPANVQQSYLNQQALLAAALHTGAQAIHPGYGLLSENASFAKLCKANHLVFIGPDGALIEKMGDKEQAKKLMQQAGIPIVPGSALVNSLQTAQKEAEKIGYPLLIKARSGGGGRGIRLVNAKEELESSLQMAVAEAKNAFGDGEVYLEKYVWPVKHVEIQLLCDDFDNIVCLGERECSIQRKNQKLLEESPSAAVSPVLREQMMEIARRIASLVHYRNVGTVEFLLDQEGRFYFLEMNTRLQVEHCVTEMVTNLDLVKWQIRMAAGIPLNFAQHDIQLQGHAIECRINAENPRLGYRPCSGVVQLLHIPGGPWVRFDTALYQGYEIPPFYDSLIGKLIVWANTREEAVRKMQAALCELVIEGVDHNSEMHGEILSDPTFIKGTYDTGFMEKRKAHDS